MNEPHEHHRTADVPSTPADSLDAGLAAGFAAPHSGQGALPAGLPKRADGHSARADVADGLPAVPGYRVLREIARGGMGRVLAARDLVLDRDVALKVLLPRANAERFVRESKITARLPHPGIPPVHALGTLADGAPFLAMKLVAGQTLAEEMNSADRPRLLQAFTQVCQAVGFAHSRGVIHRDLKPANVMVGAFGEVQVMDWGLAKVLTDGSLAHEEQASWERKRPEDVTDASQTTDYAGAAQSTDARTQAGTVLGTPAYMAPEQARGEATDARSDVFALGGILSAILTERPLYSGKSAVEVIRRAAAADLAAAHARLDGCGADAELVELCRRCLSAEPAGRPTDGRAVADGMTAYLDGVQQRLHAAERERAVAAAREAEQRKRRQVQLALAATVLLAVLGGAVAVSIYRVQAEQARSDERLRAFAERERQGRNAEAVARLLDQTDKALRAGDAAKAKVALEAARKRSAEGGAEKEAERLGRLGADLALLRDLDAVDQFRWTMVDNTFPDPAVVAARYRDALGRFGGDPDAVSADKVAVRVSASAVRERIVIALDRLLDQEKTAGVRVALRRVDANSYRDAVRDAILADNRGKIAELARQSAALEQPPGFTATLGDSPWIDVERRRRLLEVAVRRWSGDLGLLMTLGSTYANQKGGENELLRWSQAAVAARPTNATGHGILGLALKDKGRVDEAIACWTNAIALDPKYTWVHYNLGVALRRKGQLDKAIACFQQAIAGDPKHAKAHGALGSALKDKGQLDEAIVCCQKAIALDPKYAIAHCNLGNALKAKGQLDDAIGCYKKVIELDPKDAGAHFNLGLALYSKGQLDDAIACFEKAIEFKPEDAGFHTTLGLALKARGQLDNAIACHQKAIELDPNLAGAHYNLGLALADKGLLDEAIASFRKASKLDPKFAEAHARLGQGLLSRGRYAEARGAWARALALPPVNHRLRAFAFRQVQECERFLKLEARLPAILRGEEQPASARESIDWAKMCVHKQMHAAAARFFTRAFAAEAEPADSLQTGHRYNAACSAALAAAGRGKDAARLDDKERARLRKQALDWLKADLAEYAKRQQSGTRVVRAMVQQQLQHWQQDSDLAGLRDKVALAKLPAEERAACEKLWADVAALLKKAELGKEP
jgi:tetratricopeptide (TPR) repeat protein